MKKAHTLYESPTGDGWYLIPDFSGEVFIRHEANVVSGGYVARLEVEVFLSSGGGLEQQELLRLIGTMIHELRSLSERERVSTALTGRSGVTAGKPLAAH